MLLEEICLTQSQVAQLAGVSPRTVRDAVRLQRAADGGYPLPSVLAWLRERTPDPPGLLVMLKETLRDRGAAALAVAVELLSADA